MRSSIRVVFVTTVFEGVDTGPGIYAHYLWRAFRDDPDIEFHIVAPEFREIHPRLHASGTGNGSFELYSRVQTLAMEVAKAGRGTTILHGNSTHGMGKLIGYRGPLVVQVNDYETATFPSCAAEIALESGFRKMLSTAWRYYHERRVLGCATMALCNSDYTASVVGRCYGLPGRKLRVVRKAVDPSMFDRAAIPPEGDAAKCRHMSRIVFVGTDWQIKGLDTLVEAVAILSRQHPDISLTVVGPDKNDPKLLSVIRRSNAEDCIELIGRATREKLAGILWNSDVLALPSRKEALGVAILEGMAAGLPVVATAVGGIPEIVRDGVNGLLVPPRKTHALVEALDRLLRNPVECAVFSRAGQQRARDFSVETMIAAIRTIYQELSSDIGAAETQTGF